MTAAIAVTASSIGHGSTADTDVEEMVHDIVVSKVRLSDFMEDGDDSLVYLTDVMAISTSERTGIPDYLSKVLDTVYGVNGYRLVYSFNDRSIHIGIMDGFFRESFRTSIPVTIGGTLNIELGIL